MRDIDVQRLGDELRAAVQGDGAPGLHSGGDDDIAALCRGVMTDTRKLQQFGLLALSILIDRRRAGLVSERAIKISQRGST